MSAEKIVFEKLRDEFEAEKEALQRDVLALNEQFKDLAERTKKLEEKSAFVEFLRKRVGGGPAPVEDELGKVAALVGEMSAKSVKRRFLMSRDPDDQPSPTILDAVKDALDELGEEELFTVDEMYRILKRRGVIFSSKTPRATISNALIRLTNQGHVEVVGKGVGSTPSTYKRAPSLF